MGVGMSSYFMTVIDGQQSSINTLTFLKIYQPIIKQDATLVYLNLQLFHQELQSDKKFIAIPNLLTTAMIMPHNFFKALKILVAYDLIELREKQENNETHFLFKIKPLKTQRDLLKNPQITAELIRHNKFIYNQLIDQSNEVDEFEKTFEQINIPSVVSKNDSKADYDHFDHFLVLQNIQIEPRVDYTILINSLRHKYQLNEQNINSFFKNLNNNKIPITTETIEKYIMNYLNNIKVVSENKVIKLNSIDDYVTYFKTCSIDNLILNKAKRDMTITEQNLFNQLINEYQLKPAVINTLFYYALDRSTTNYTSESFIIKIAKD